ncbi:MAG: Hpt domain-containing protein [Deltaproteobacteria bacterium]|nr:Hpt domain-containing protein [Deltaproteobacteria bacterium]
MANPTEAAVQEQFQMLRKGYLERLEEKIHQMEELGGRLIQGGGSADDLSGLLQLAHKLSGSGAIYGCKELSQRAGDLEVFLRGLPPQIPLITPSQTARLAEHLESLLTAYRQNA